MKHIRSKVLLHRITSPAEDNVFTFDRPLCPRACSDPESFIIFESFISYNWPPYLSSHQSDPPPLPFCMYIFLTRESEMEFSTHLKRSTALGTEEVVASHTSALQHHPLIVPFHFFHGRARAGQQRCILVFIPRGG